MKIGLPKINHDTVVFTKHAKGRLNQRKLDEDMVIRVMRKPNATYQIDDGKSSLLVRLWGRKFILFVNRSQRKTNGWSSRYGQEVKMIKAIL